MMRSYDPLLGKIVAMWWDDPKWDPEEGPTDPKFVPVPKLTIGLVIHETADTLVLAHEVELDGSKLSYGKTTLPRRVATGIGVWGGGEGQTDTVATTILRDRIRRVYEQFLHGEVRGYEKKAAIKPLAQSVDAPADVRPSASSASWSDVQSELHWRVCHDAAVWEPEESED